MSIIKVVSIGGGTGQASLLRGLKQFDLDLTAIVTVLDSGRSTGVIRKKFNMAAPGDIRNCIIALSESEEEFNKIFQHRFKKHFKGMNVGNLLLAAMTEMGGSFGSAIEDFSKLFKLKGKVYPSTLNNTHVCAELKNGKKVCGEHEIRNTNTPPIKNIFLKDKTTKGHPKAVKAIREADYIIIGPGGLYTSIIVNFLIEDIRKAVVSSKAKKFFIPNLATQPGVIEDTSLLTHINEITRYLSKGKKTKKLLDYIILNNRLPPASLLKKYEKENTFYVEPKKSDIAKLERKGYKIVERDLIEKKTKQEWNKPIYMRHNSLKLAETIMSTIKPNKPIKGVILAAGAGSRMKPFSLQVSKVMLKFLGKPLLAHHVDEMIKNDIKEIIFICNPYNLQEVKGYFDSHYAHIKFDYCIQKEQLGPSHALLAAERYLKRSYLLLKYGDSASMEEQITNIIREFSKSKGLSGMVTLRNVSNPSGYGIAKFQNEKLIEIVEKPKKNIPSKLANVGLAILDADLFFNSIHKNGYKKVIPPPQYLLMNKQAIGYWVSNGKRVDVGRAHNIISANKLLIDRFGGKIESPHIAKSAKISDKAYISPEAIVESGAVIGDYSSIYGYVGKNARIENSVIMEGTKIGENCIIKNSVIGKNNFVGDRFRTMAGEEKIYVKDRYVHPGMKVGLFTGDNVIIKKNLKSYPGKMVFPNKIVSEDIKKDKLIRTIVFDADNTLWDTKSISKLSDMAAMRFFAKKLNKKPDTLYSNWKKIVAVVINEKSPMKRHRMHSYDLLLIKYGVKNHSRMAKEGVELMKKALSKNIKFMPNFGSAKPHLKKYTLALCTQETKDLFETKLNALGLKGYFDVTVTSDKVGEMKPSKKYYDLLFKKIDQVPNECLFIGDNYEKDLAIPHKMGATTVLFSKNNNNKADFKVKNYAEFLELLKEI